METEDHIFAGRVRDVGNETGEVLMPIDLSLTPLLSLKESLKPIESLIPHLDSYVFNSTSKITSTFNHCGLPYNLTEDEAASITLYTMEFASRDNSLYKLLNSALRTADRKKIKPWNGYLKLLLSALAKLPSYSSSAKTLWRAVDDDSLGSIAKGYEKNRNYQWWAFSSCTTNMEILKEFLTNDRSHKRLIFCIHFKSHSVDVSPFSCFKENEVLLLPARYFKVINSCELSSDTILIELDEMDCPSQIIGIDFPKITTQQTQSQTQTQTQPQPQALTQTLSQIRHEEKVESYQNPLNLSRQKDLKKDDDYHHKLFLEAENEYKLKHYPKAFQLFTSLETRGNYRDYSGHILYRIAMMYKYGEGISANEHQAKKYIEKALPLLKESYTPEAYFDLGHLYYYELDKKDPKKALELWRLSANQGHSSAQNNLARMYEQGEGGLSRDLNEALKLYKLSANQGNSSAEYNLGNLYLTGELKEGKNIKEACRYFTLAADRGHTKAQSSLSELYRKGVPGIVPKDPVKADNLKRLSTAQNKNSCSIQ